MKNGSLLHRIWWYWGDRALPGWPWIWRWYCWFQRHHDDSYGSCIYCGKRMT